MAMTTSPTPRWRRPAALLAWAAFLAGAGVVLFLGSDEFSASTTHGFLTPVLQFLFPDLSANDRYLLHVRIRKSAHVIEYAILALLALQAVLLSLRSVIGRRVAVAFFLVLLVALFDESRQAFSDHRTGSFGDVLLDLGGAALALGLALWLRRIRLRRHATEAG